MRNRIPSALRKLHCNLTMDDVSSFGGYSAGQTPTQNTIADSSDGGGWQSGLVDIFTAATTAGINIYRTVNPPKPTPIPPGTGVYNPQTGQYMPAVGTPNMNMLLIGGLFILGAVLILPRLK